MTRDCIVPLYMGLYMAEERRNGYGELLDAFKDFKQDMKEDIKEIKDELKQIDSKIKDHVDVNNKFYFNGFPADKHVADHHVIDNIIEKVNDTKSLKNKLVEEVLKFALIAALTWIAYASWDKFNAEIKPPIDSKPKVEQNDKSSR